VAETQEPATDIEIELQESEAQNAATLPSSSQVAETPATQLQLKHKNQLLILKLRYRNQRSRVLQHYFPYIKKLKHKKQLPFL
jgi:hypothetical protein